MNAWDWAGLKQHGICPATPVLGSKQHGMCGGSKGKIAVVNATIATRPKMRFATFFMATSLAGEYPTAFAAARLR